MNNLLPVAHEAARLGMKCDVLLGRGVTASPPGFPLAGSSIPYSQIWAFVPIVERWRSWREARSQASQIQRVAAEVAPQWVGALLRLGRFLREELMSAIGLRKGLQQLLSAAKPSCVVSTSDFWPFENILFQLCREMGIPGLCIQHGIINRYWWPSPSSHILLWGEPFAEEMARLGAPLECLLSCGMPATDSLFTKYSKNLEIPSVAPSTPVKCVILSNTNGQSAYPALYAKYAKLFSDLVTQAGPVQWHIKLHPNEDDSFYRALGKNVFEKLTILPRTMPLEAAVAQADLAGTLCSTAGLEAMIMRRPLIVFDIDPIIREWAWWPNWGGGEYVASSGQMREYLERFSAQAASRAALLSKQDAFLARTFVNQGRAARAIVNLISQVSGAIAA